MKKHQNFIQSERTSGATLIKLVYNYRAHQYELENIYVDMVKSTLDHVKTYSDLVPQA